MATEKLITSDPSFPSPLRAAAETQLAQSPASAVSVRSDTELLHELEVHQIELQLQNTSLKEANIGLEESRDRFVDFFEFAPVGYLTITDQGLVAEINLTGAALLGSERMDIQRHPFARFVSPDDADSWHLHYCGALKTDERQTCALALLREDGSSLHVRLDSLRLIKTGQEPSLRVVLTDISEHKRTEAALQESEARFKAMFEQAGVGVAQLDSDTGRFIQVNGKYADIVGYSREELKQTGFQTITHPEDVAADLANMGQLKAGAIDQFCMEKRYIHKNGHTVWVNLTVTPMWQKGAKPTQHMAVVEDITERKKTENALRESEDRLRSFLDKVPVGIFTSTREGKFLYLNPAMPKIMGYDSCEEMMEVVNRRSIAEVLYVNPLERQTLVAELDQGISRWKYYENRYRRKDGRIIDADIAISERLDEITKEPSLYGIVTDITKRKQAETDLLAAKSAAESADAAKSRFLAAASHDLRQPMQALGLFNEALAGTELNAGQRRISDYLSQSIQSMSDVLDALLDISKFDAGAVEVCPAEISLEALAHRINAEYFPMATSKSLRFKLCLPFHDMAVMTDGKLLMSLLGNLIGNALKYTQQGGVLVAIRRRGPSALMQVWDTGTGIPAEYLDTIYEEYFQLGNPERDKAKGLGLGLAIAKRIAKLLGTEVVCRSRLGKGSVFEFRLPLTSRAEGATPDQIDPPLVSHAKSAGRRIVLVEDDLMVATATKMALESCGMTVAQYNTAEDALADSATADADFYISDLRLPGLSGIEFLDAIQRRAMKPIHAVLVTGDTAIDQKEMMRSSSWRVLFKPVGLSSLLSAIESQDSAQ